MYSSKVPLCSVGQQYRYVYNIAILPSQRPTWYCTYNLSLLVVLWVCVQSFASTIKGSFAQGCHRYCQESDITAQNLSRKPRSTVPQAKVSHDVNVNSRFQCDKHQKCCYAEDITSPPEFNTNSNIDTMWERQAKALVVISHCLRKKKRPLCVIPVNVIKKGRPIVLTVTFLWLLCLL